MSLEKLSMFSLFFAFAVVFGRGMHVVVTGNLPPAAFHKTLTGQTFFTFVGLSVAFGVLALFQ